MADSSSLNTRLVSRKTHRQADGEDKGTDGDSGQASDPADKSTTGGAEFLLVVVGKSGTGKSSLCNQIVGDKPCFPVDSGLSTCTLQDKEECINRYGRTFCVLDTHDYKKSELETLTNSLKKRLVSFNNKVFFLFCVRCDARYAVEEHSVYQDLKTAWEDDEDFSNRLIVVFTHGEDLPNDTKWSEDLQTGKTQLEANEKAKYGSLGSFSQAFGSDKSGREIYGKRSEKERRLQELLKIAWPPLTCLVNDAQNKFIFSDQEKEDDEVRALIDFVTNYTPPSLPIWRRVAGWLKRHYKPILLCIIILALALPATKILMIYLDQRGNNSTTSFPSNSSHDQTYDAGTNIPLTEPVPNPPAEPAKIPQTEPAENLPTEPAENLPTEPAKVSPTEPANIHPQSQQKGPPPEPAKVSPTEPAKHPPTELVNPNDGA